MLNKTAYINNISGAKVMYLLYKISKMQEQNLGLINQSSIIYSSISVYNGKLRLRKRVSASTVFLVKRGLLWGWGEV